jgi:hypothetical protein
MTTVQIARGTKIYVAPLNAGDRVFPEKTVFTAGATAAAAATSITITMSPAITREIVAPIYLLFVDLNGQEDLVKVTSNIAVGATTLTVAALKRAIAEDAEAIYPVSIAGRESASFTNNNTQQDINVFENDGYKDNVTTVLGGMLQLNGFYNPLDAGWNTFNHTLREFKEVYIEIEYPKPAPHYTTGQIIKGFGGVKGVPIEAANQGDIIKSNVEVDFRGVISFVDPV